MTSVVEPLHCRTDAYAGLANVVVQRIHQPGDDFPQTHISRAVVFGILPDVPPGQIARCVWQLGGLADVPVWCSGPAGDLRVIPDGSFCRAAGRRVVDCRAGCGGAVPWLQPCLFPKEQASGFASAVRTAIAACFEMDCALDPASSYRKHGIARLVRSLINLEFLAAECEHLRHERHPIELAVAVEGL